MKVLLTGSQGYLGTVMAPILRAGVGFLDGMLSLVPSARVAHVGVADEAHALDHPAVLDVQAGDDPPGGHVRLAVAIASGRVKRSS